MDIGSPFTMLVRFAILYRVRRTMATVRRWSISFKTRLMVPVGCALLVTACADCLPIGPSAITTPTGTPQSSPVPPPVATVCAPGLPVVSLDGAGLTVDIRWIPETTTASSLLVEEYSAQERWGSEEVAGRIVRQTAGWVQYQLGSDGRFQFKVSTCGGQSTFKEYRVSPPPSQTQPPPVVPCRSVFGWSPFPGC